MRLPDEWLSSVFFLGIEGDKGRHYAGTGFYFLVESEFNPALSRIYFVTARHNIEGARELSGELFVRVNTEDGGSVHAVISKDEWTFHEDPTVDVAVVSVRFAEPGTDGAQSMESTRLHAEACLTEARIKEYDVGIGSDISVIGLFTMREGKDRNIPIVRSGIIAAMPGEPIDDGTPHVPYQAYLAELMSIGGLSGSPAFVHPRAGPLHVHASEPTGDGRIRVTTRWNQPSFVLGLVRSHWDERPPHASKDLPRREWLNRGISAITPITGVLDVLDYSIFKEERAGDAEEEAKQARSAP